LMVQANAKAHREFVAGLLPVIREIQNTGATTLQSIADCLSRRGIATRTGRSNWYPTQVRNILQTAGKDTFMPKSATSSNSSN